MAANSSKTAKANGPEIAKAYVQVIPTTTGIKKTLESEMGDAGSKSGSGFAKRFGKAALAGIGAATAAAMAGAFKLGKEALSDYADYEQLVGGVETLFKDSAETVGDSAAAAFKTAGLSANAYMETVTGFSASLISSLGGDTVEAARIADQAIIDMSDNANKMGSSIESIQNAYQGFAKQNYTMLDNLKLGYGGTQAEMQRLLDHAKELSGIEYDMSSFADVAEAIHVIQTEMGIAGTTALEAEATISGSAAMLKASFENLLAGLGNADADLSGLIGNVIESGTRLMENTKPIIENILSAFPDAINGMVDAVTPLLPTVLEAGGEVAASLLTGIVSALPDLLPVLFDVGINLIGEVISGIVSSLPELTFSVLELAGALIGALVEGFRSAKEKVTDFFRELMDDIREAFGLPRKGKSGKNAGTEIGAELAQGIGAGFNAAMPGMYDSTAADLNTALKMQAVNAQARLNASVNGNFTGAGTQSDADKMAASVSAAVKDAMKGGMTATVYLDGYNVSQQLYDPMQLVTQQRGASLVGGLR